MDLEECIDRIKIRLTCCTIGQATVVALILKSAFEE
jgi:hypothetical protein